METSEFCCICKLLSSKYYKMRKYNYYNICCDDCMIESETLTFNDTIMVYYDINNLEYKYIKIICFPIEYVVMV